MNARRVIDRFFGLVALLIARGFYRRIELQRIEVARADGPMVIVANHFNGFMDVVLLTAALGRLPRFVAKATLKKSFLARPFLALAGTVFVARRVDIVATDPLLDRATDPVLDETAAAQIEAASPSGRGDQGEAAARRTNADAFADCHAALRAGQIIAIFPEGTTHDREALAPVRTGAARIALGARADGVSDVVVVPVGLSYGDKTRVRDEVLVEAGEAIAVPDIGPRGADDHQAVQELTATIAARLGELTAGVDDPFVAWAFDRAATCALTTPDQPDPPLADRRRVARALIEAPAAARKSVSRTLANYVLLLDLNGLDDAEVVGSDRRLVPRALLFFGLTWLLAPILGWLVLVNLPAVALVLSVDRFVKVPVTKGTVRALVAAAAFSITWLVVAMVLVDGFAPVLGVFVVQAPLVGLCAWVLEGNLEVARRLLSRRAARRASFRLPELAAARAELTDAVAAAVPAAIGPGGSAG
jgi:1-acyl-sn-glycerol-3-phosphate acyltransferase